MGVISLGRERVGRTWKLASLSHFIRHKTSKMCALAESVPQTKHHSSDQVENQFVLASRSLVPRIAFEIRVRVPSESHTLEWLPFGEKAKWTWACSIPTTHNRLVLSESTASHED